MCHTQYLIVPDGSDDAEEEIPSEVTHPLKSFSPTLLFFNLRLQWRNKIPAHALDKTKASVVLGSHFAKFNVS